MTRGRSSCSRRWPSTMTYAEPVPVAHSLVDENLERVVLRCMSEDVVRLEHLVE